MFSKSSTVRLISHLRTSQFRTRLTYSKIYCPSAQFRSFSNEALKEAFKKVKRDREAAAAAAAGINNETKVDKLEEEKVDTTTHTDGAKSDTAADDTKTDAADSKRSDTSAESKIDYNQLYHKAISFVRDSREIFNDNMKIAWGELTGSSKESSLERKFEQAESFRKTKTSTDPDDEDTESKPVYDGPSAIVVVKEGMSYWEKMSMRLNDAPLIREILKGAKVYGKAAADTDVGKQAQKASQSIKDKIEDAREFWETSQNPVVHTLSNVWDSLTGETEEGIAVAAIRKKDPKFIKEDWAEEVKGMLAPTVIKAHLEGNLRALKPWMTEGVYAKIAAEVKLRKQDGIVIDSNILEIDENALVLRYLEGGGPVIVVVYMVQQINCIRNAKGEIIEGGESEVRAKFYSMAFQQVYEEGDSDENNAVLKWKIVEYSFQGDIPYY